MPWRRLIPLLAAAAFLSAAVGFFVAQDRAPGAGSVDVGFQQDMITHHEQALAMSLIAVERAGDYEVRSFAREILIAQSREVGQMLSSLNRWGFEPGEPDRTAMAWMGDPRPVTSMPGLASTTEMTALMKGSRNDTNTMFLSLMIDHHRGGVHMAQYASSRAKDSTVRAMAAAMARNQTLEVTEYGRVLARLGRNADTNDEPAPTDHAHK